MVLGSMRIGGWVAVVALAGCSGSSASSSGSEGETDPDGSSGSTSASSTSDGTTATGQDSATSSTTTGDPSASASDSASTSASGSDTESTTGSAAQCPADALAPGLYTDLELEHDGLTRVYDIFVPTAHDGSTALPIVFNHHGFGSNKGQQQLFSAMNADAEERGFIVVYPQGTDNSWNAGPACCGLAVSNDVDDVGFIRALVQQVETEVCVDPNRVYATGMSNGGFLSHRLACEAADVFAAVAPVAGVLGIPAEDCQPSRPVPLIHFHGTLDQLVPYNGIPSVPAVAQGWADRNGCTGDSQVSFMMDDVTCETWDPCDAGSQVSLCTIEGAGHCWPGQPLCPFGSSTETISANIEMFDFFDQHSL